MKAKNTFKTKSSEVDYNEESAVDGFWRFLDIKYVADDLVFKQNTEKRDEIVKRGVFKMNGVEYSDIDKYHKAVMEELKSTTSCNNSDNSYDVLECETDSGADNNEIVRDLSNAVVDSDTEDEPEQITSSNDVQSGKRISRRGSVDSSEEKNSSSWGFGLQW